MRQRPDVTRGITLYVTRGKCFQAVMKSLQLAFALDALLQLEGYEVQTPFANRHHFRENTAHAQCVHACLADR